MFTFIEWRRCKNSKRTYVACQRGKHELWVFIHFERSRHRGKVLQRLAELLIVEDGNLKMSSKIHTFIEVPNIYVNDGKIRLSLVCL